jgi:hypothetical protein
VSAEAFESRLRILEEEILRLSKLAAEYVDQSEQDKCWLLAQDLQREARELRSEIKKTQEQSIHRDSLKSHLMGSFHRLTSWFNFKDRPIALPRSGAS